MPRKESMLTKPPFLTRDSLKELLYKFMLNAITGMKSQSKLWKQIPQRAAGYRTLRFAG
jgi:hypothetical protein